MNMYFPVVGERQIISVPEDSTGDVTGFRVVESYPEKQEIVVRSFGRCSYINVNTVYFRLKVWRVIEVDGDYVRLQLVI